MNDSTGLEITDCWIISCRGSKNIVDPQRPYSWFVEKERTASGSIEEVATIFLSNRECPFKCLMCDLWKNTTDLSVPAGSIPDQIEWALNQLPGTKHLKLYNSGSFFDPRAIPERDYGKIAAALRHFKTVIVESHPAFINEKCLAFRDMIKTDLQVGIGLEIASDEILTRLNKKMTLKDFSDAVRLLSENDILSRAFILLRPPFLSEKEGIYWAKMSIDFAFASGVECCVIIPVRSGNGAMDYLQKKGFFTPPDIRSLEKVIEYGIELKAGRVFADVWDLNLFSRCKRCIDERTNRLITMNLGQRLISRIKCTCDI